MPKSHERECHLFVVSAKSSKALRVYLRRYLAFCSEAQEDDLPNICYTACIGREHYRFRFSTVVHSMEELIKDLQVACSLGENKFLPISSNPRVVFAFAGQGSQFQGMCRSPCSSIPSFAAILRDYDCQADHLLGFSLLPFLLDSDLSGIEASIEETHVGQTCIYIYQCAMVRWLGTLGIRPSAVLPHSLGEIAAAGNSFCDLRARFML